MRPHKSLKQIKKDAPVLFELLGKNYVDALKTEMGALAERATINPFFKILYVSDTEDVEGLFAKALESKAISKERLKRFREDRNNVNIQNFINELRVLEPL